MSDKRNESNKSQVTKTHTSNLLSDDQQVQITDYIYT